MMEASLSHSNIDIESSMKTSPTPRTGKLVKLIPAVLLVAAVCAVAAFARAPISANADSNVHTLNNMITSVQIVDGGQPPIEVAPLTPQWIKIYFLSDIDLYSFQATIKVDEQVRAVGYPGGGQYTSLYRESTLRGGRADYASFYVTLEEGGDPAEISFEISYTKGENDEVKTQKAPLGVLTSLGGPAPLANVVIDGSPVVVPIVTPLVATWITIPLTTDASITGIQVTLETNQSMVLRTAYPSERAFSSLATSASLVAGEVGQTSVKLTLAEAAQGTVTLTVHVAFLSKGDAQTVDLSFDVRTPGGCTGNDGTHVKLVSQGHSAVEGLLSTALDGLFPVSRVTALHTEAAQDAKAVLFTRGGELVDGDVLKAYLDNGGIVITEWSKSHEVYNAVFDTAIPRPANFLRPLVEGRGCSDLLMPKEKLSEADPFWSAIQFVDHNLAPSCGYDLSSLPDITPLGSYGDLVEGDVVSMAYKNYGAGRVYFFEADWNDGEDSGMWAEPEFGNGHFFKELISWGC